MASGCTAQELRLLAVWPLSLAAYRGDVLKTARSGRVSAAPTILSWSERVLFLQRVVDCMHLEERGC